MENVPDPRQYQARSNKRISAAIDELVGRARDEAFGEYGGRLVRFDHRWHSIDPAPVAVEARITNVYFDHGDEGGDWQLMFEVVVRNPRNGHDETIVLSPGQFDFKIK
jgi:hypothetical protein